MVSWSIGDGHGRLCLGFKWYRGDGHGRFYFGFRFCQIGECVIFFSPI